MKDGYALIHGDALRIPLRDASVDAIITSPPYFALRSYQDDGEHYDGQIGSEPTPADFLAALWSVTDELWRVLKPTGSLFVNLGDKYAGSGGHNNAGISRASQFPLPVGVDGRPEGEMRRRTQPEVERGDQRTTRRAAPDRYNQSTDVPAKSLMGLPWRYALGLTCPDIYRPRWPNDDVVHPQWTLRAEVIWSKPNGLPESVTDRVRRSHEQWFHLTKQGRYYAAVDEIREQKGTRWTGSSGSCPRCGLPKTVGSGSRDAHPRATANSGSTARPTSPTESPTDSTSAPFHTDSYSTTSAATAGACDPTTSNPSPIEPISFEATRSQRPTSPKPTAGTATPTARSTPTSPPTEAECAVCACGPVDDDGIGGYGKLPGSVWEIPSEPLKVPDRIGVDHFAAFPQEWVRRLVLGWTPSGICVKCREGRRPVVEKKLAVRADTNWGAKFDGSRDAHLHNRMGTDEPIGTTEATITGYRCACDVNLAPTRPAIVFDPFVGTGTVPMVARALGRYGIGLDLSRDYLRLATWRIGKSRHGAKSINRTNRERQGHLW